MGFACIWLALMVFLSLFLLIFFSTRPLQGLQILSFDSLYSNSTHYELELLISAHNPNLHAIKIGQYNYKYHPTASNRRHRQLPSNNNSINSIIDDNDDHDDGDDDDDDEGGHKWSQSTNIDLHLFVQQQTVSGTFSDEILLDYVTHFYPANDSIRTPTPLLLQPLTTTTVKARVLAQKSSRPGLR